MDAHIHWHEGLFLQPHHLQRMQRSLRDMVSAERKLAWSYPYGLIEASISRDELEAMRVRFERLRAIMPSGLEVNFPANAELPSLDIKQAFAKGAGSFRIFLGVPLWFNSRANTVRNGEEAESRVKLLYRVGELECTDENTGENTRPIQVRRVNARLLFEHEDTSDLEVIPLLRIVRGAGGQVGMPQEDTEFVPPCLVLSGSNILRDLVRDLVANVEASRKALVVQVTGGGFSVDTMRGVQFEQVMRLRTLNRFSARLPSLLDAPQVTPFAIYVELRELLGELMALHPDRDDFDVAPYNHDEPYICFRELSNKIRPFLKGVVKERFIQVEFKDVNGALTVPMTDEHFTAPNAYFVAIRTKQDPIGLARFVEDEDKFKFMPQSLARAAIRGIKLKWERQPPLGLPASSDLHYFRLDRSSNERRWEQIQKEKSAVVVWEMQRSENSIDKADAAFTLYMTVPN
jgi:type VI secretion system protein ImpJ